MLLAAKGEPRLRPLSGHKDCFHMCMRTLSDVLSLKEISLGRVDLEKLSSAGTVTLYKACVAMANYGISYKAETLLPIEFRELLRARRLMKERDFTQAERVLIEIDPQGEFAELVHGDSLFLVGQILHWRGQQKEAAKLFAQASQKFRLASDTHRELRALINAQICTAMLETYLSGEIYALELEAKLQGFDDLVGNIKKSRAMELMCVSRWAEASTELKLAMDHYDRDGYPEDRSICICLLAILSLQLARPDEAEKLFFSIHEEKGKIESFKEIYKTLASGRFPDLGPEHPLAVVRWKLPGVKNQSNAGKLMSRLQETPLTRDELIEVIWPGETWSQAHVHRLHSLVNTLRKKWGTHVLFDGTHYKISS